MNTKRFSTFEGVFTPTTLSILGVIMYLRLGWVVGNVGLGKALLIIAIGNIITLITGLSISSLTTNIRIGTGGAYSIISRSLGLEVGGAIGIPLYLSQALSVAFYITGFTECWRWVFPGHNLSAVALIAWIILLCVSYISAKLAFRLQYFIMAIIVFSLASIFLGKTGMSVQGAFWQGEGGVSFWKTFAIFFPAVTGILAGVSMSGELKAPERSIPVGTLSAIGVSFLIYAALAFWFASSASYSQLVKNTAIIIELARWRSLVVAGIMGATISSALCMFIGSSRTLLALAKHRHIPLSSSFEYMNKKGEPTSAILFTALLSLVTLLFGTLDKIAGILTMFFLITYGILNISVFIEKGIGILSFRPTFNIPFIVSLLGGIGCIYVMFLINPVFSIIAIAVIIAIYILLLRKDVHGGWPDVRKGIFIFIAEQAIKISSRLPYHPKIWKPNLLIPVEEPRNWMGLIDFLKAVVYPNGRVEIFKILEKGRFQSEKDRRAKDSAKNTVSDELSLLSGPLKEDGILVSELAVESADFLEGAAIIMQAAKGAFLPANVLFLKLGLTTQKDDIVKEIVRKAESLDMGIMIFRLHPKVGLGQKQTINLWIRKGSPNVDLAALISLQIEKNWDAGLNLLQVVDTIEEEPQAQVYLSRIKKMMRLPKDARLNVIVGSFSQAALNPPLADINIFGMAQECNIAWIKDISEKINTSILFLRDSKQEKAVS